MFGHCSQDRLLKVKSFAENKLSFNRTSSDDRLEELKFVKDRLEELKFVKDRLEELFKESKDAAVIDRSMVEYFKKDDHLSIAGNIDEEMKRKSSR